MSHVHFWTLRDEAPRAWDPDLEPDLHQSAYGHAFLELYCRLRAQGRPVSIGPTPPRTTRSVVVSLEELTEWEGRVRPRKAAGLAAAMLRQPRPPALVVIRVDIPLDVRSPDFATLELMPTAASIERPAQLHLPMLPQRGLVPRDPDRGDRVETVALKAYAANVPVWVDEEFARGLESIGVSLRVDTEHQGRWRFFDDVDVLLCTHDATSLGDDRRKPATKLVNAWRAGVIPICGSHPGYAEIGRDGDTMLVADTADEVLAAIGRLRSDPALVTHLRGGIREVARDLDPESALEQYWAAFVTAPRAGRRNLVRSLVVTVVSRAAPKAVRTVLNDRVERRRATGRLADDLGPHPH